MTLKPLSRSSSSSRAIAASLCLISANAFANNIEVITVTATNNTAANAQDSAVGSAIKPDLADWLDSVPGAAVNRNGPVTGIAQYRGLFGDRVAVAIDGHKVVGAGPNAMDAPLSYVTPLIVESMSLYRGIAPVSAGIDTLGGTIDVKMRKAKFSNSDDWQYKGAMLAGYQLENKADTLASWVNISSQNQALMVFVNNQTGEDYENGNGIIVAPTTFNKSQAGLDYRTQFGTNELGASYHYVDTHDSGTPALPMDIDYIYGSRFNVDGKFQLGQWQADWLVGYVDAEHTMDNFNQRSNMMPEMFRKNYATAETTDIKFHLSRANGNNQWQLGLDGVFAKHNSTITNPNNGMFNVVNFNGVEDNRVSAFVQWQHQMQSTTYSLGARLKRNEANAGMVSHHMAMMNMMVGQLVNGINGTDRSVEDSNYDIAFNLRTTLSEQASFYAGIGVKQRAPSYQERYLWMPMEATGGLADGKTYIGNINLDSETASQLELGLSYNSGDFYIAPHVYYQQIDDYIQGVTTSNMAAQMVAKMMMGDESPLQFANVDAQIYGADVQWHYLMNNSWKLSGHASYVRGQRRDVEDNLYRIAPANVGVAVAYLADTWQTELSFTAYARQDKVADQNFEEETGGYGVVNFSGEYDFNDSITLRAGIDNLLDRNYQNHLGGYYRVKNGPIDNMSRMPGEGRNSFVELDYRF